MIVRPAREEDYDDLARVWFEGYAASAPAGSEIPSGLLAEMRTRLSRETANGAWTIFAADDGGRIVGLLAFARANAELNELFVGDGARSRGVGKALLEQAKHEMADGFWLRTHSANVNAQRFYAREGMTHTHDAPHPRYPETMYRHYAWKPWNDARSLS